MCVLAGAPVESSKAFILSERRERWPFIWADLPAGKVGKRVIFAGGEVEEVGRWRESFDALSVREGVVRRVSV